MALPTKPKRDRAITIRISKQSYDQLKRYKTSHGLSQASVIEILLEQEAQEQNRLKGKPGRYKRR